ncbi:LysR family transcriptional regulator [Rathayibacter sp. VKM Ac-2835]|uniref:LysR family transcriptional regulator n=1 Tax=Rathayibacter sp. VKM Ac-2835 TaxID=2739043 RepID=UPI001563C907|nr:LysR family transcriptional regulator [Rathayibacter sp. VKM Ac-2835]NRG43028.1 LysR family transcriptional regulator [Rathayibacter sp. VKM Ac-2835]
MFSLTQLQCFVAVAEELHFGAAAARLQMTQPPLSRQIQLLERELGALLFTRTSRSVVLTGAGAALLAGARGILNLAERTTSDVRRVAAGGAGTITLGYTAMAAQSALPGLMRRLTDELPDVTVVLRELVSSNQMDELLTGTIDVGLLRPVAPRPGIALRPIFSEPLVLAVPEAHRLAARSTTATAADVAAEPFLMYSPTVARYFHDLVLTFFTTAGEHPRIVHHAGQVQTLLSFVHAGLGVALVPASAGLVLPHGLSLVPLTPGPTAAHPVQLDAAWARDSINPLVHRTLDLLLTDAVTASDDAAVVVDVHRSAS